MRLTESVRLANRWLYLGYKGRVTSGSMQGQIARGEPRLPAAIAVLLAIALYALLPSQLLVGPRLVVPALEILLFVPLVVANPRRMTRESQNLRRLAIGLILLIAIANAVALLLLVRQLVTGQASEGTSLLVAAGQVWLTNILLFSLAYWELDRGGSVQRTHTPRPRLPAADFRFPQDEDHDAIAEVSQRSSEKSGWVPGFLDYLYFSITNSSAFSPTDAMPLTPRAKMLMATQSVSALILSILVISRGISLLK